MNFFACPRRLLWKHSAAAWCLLLASLYTTHFGSESSRCCIFPSYIIIFSFFSLLLWLTGVALYTQNSLATSSFSHGTPKWNHLLLCIFLLNSFFEKKLFSSTSPKKVLSFFSFLPSHQLDFIIMDSLSLYHIANWK